MSEQIQVIWKEKWTASIFLNDVWQQVEEEKMSQSIAGNSDKN